MSRRGQETSPPGRGDRPKGGALRYRGLGSRKRPQAYRPGGKPARARSACTGARRSRAPFVPEPRGKVVVEAAPLPTKVQTLWWWTADEKQHGASTAFSKGAGFPRPLVVFRTSSASSVRARLARFNGQRRADSKDRIEEGARAFAFRRSMLDTPKGRGKRGKLLGRPQTQGRCRPIKGHDSSSRIPTVMVAEQAPRGLAVQGGSGHHCEMSTTCWK